MPQAFVPPSPPKFGASPAAPTEPAAAPEKIPALAPTIKMPNPASRAEHSRADADAHLFKRPAILARQEW